MLCEGREDIFVTSFNANGIACCVALLYVLKFIEQLMSIIYATGLYCLFTTKIFLNILVVFITYFVE